MSYCNTSTSVCSCRVRALGLDERPGDCAVVVTGILKFSSKMDKLLIKTAYLLYCSTVRS